MITINTIIDGISAALFAKFGERYEIYTENIPHCLKEPCFAIKSLNPTIKQGLGNRYYKTNSFCIHYFPKSTEPKAEINDVEERLFSCLEYITVDGDLTRGTNMNGENHDNVLFFFVNYNAFVFRKPDEIPVMETVDQRTNLKG